MLIDCHIHAGELGNHYPKWWIDELYRTWGGAYNWAYGRPNMSVGERLVFQMDELGIDMMCIMTSDHRRVYPHEKGPFAPNEFLVEVRDTAPDRLPRSRSYFKRDGELATSMEFSDRSQYCEPLL